MKHGLVKCSYNTTVMTTEERKGDTAGRDGTGEVRSAHERPGADGQRATITEVEKAEGGNGRRKERRDPSGNGPEGWGPGARGKGARAGAEAPGHLQPQPLPESSSVQQQFAQQRAGLSCQQNTWDAPSIPLHAGRPSPLRQQDRSGPTADKRGRFPLKTRLRE